MHEQALDRRAHLAGFAETRVHAPWQCPIDIGVLTDDGAGNAAEFQLRSSQAGTALNQPSHLRAAREGIEPNVRLLEQPRANVAAVAVDEIEVPGREPCVDQYLAE